MLECLNVSFLLLAWPDAFTAIGVTFFQSDGKKEFGGIFQKTPSRSFYIFSIRSVPFTCSEHEENCSRCQIELLKISYEY